MKRVKKNKKEALKKNEEGETAGHQSEVDMARRREAQVGKVKK